MTHSLRAPTPICLTTLSLHMVHKMFLYRINVMKLISNGKNLQYSEIQIHCFQISDFSLSLFLVLLWYFSSWDNKLTILRIQACSAWVFWKSEVRVQFCSVFTTNLKCYPKFKHKRFLSFLLLGPPFLRPHCYFVK